jgi:hypothetical protein
MYQQLWGYKVEEKLYLEVREQKRLNTTGLEDKRKNRTLFTISFTLFQLESVFPFYSAMREIPYVGQQRVSFCLFAVTGHLNINGKWISRSVRN